MAKKDNPTPEDEIAAELMLKDADEALQKEKLERLWEEWGSTVIGVALMIIFGTMIGVGWKNWRQSVHENQTAQLIQLQDKGAAMVMLEQDDLSGSYEAIAKMMAASEIAKTEGATPHATSAMVYNLMIDASNAGLPRYYDIMAEWTKLRAQYDADKDAVKADIAENMIDLANRRKNPFEALILMEAGLIYGEDGQTHKAMESFEKALEAKTMTPEVEAQIREYMTIYSIEGEGSKS